MVWLGAAIGVANGYLEHARRLSPAERELFFMEREPEVRLAREYIAGENLRGKFAEMLLDFARDLVRQRIN